MKTLTPRQREVLAVIKGSIERTGKAPTIREIGTALGVKATEGIRKHIAALVSKGAVIKNGDQSRGLSLPP